MLESRAVVRSAAQVKRGTKQTCKSETCGSPYYDLRRAPAACPYCGTSCEFPAITIVVDFETLGKQRPPRFNRRVEPPRHSVEASKSSGDEVDTADEHTEKDPVLPSAAEDLLIEIDDDDDAQTPAEPESELA